MAEAVIRSSDEISFSFALSEFLDTFYGHIQRGDVTAAAASLALEPPPAFSSQIHAFVGGIAEHLSRRWHLPSIPDWTEHPSRFLKEPLFGQTGPAVRYLYLEESPLAFRRRLIFTEAIPRRRARMPVDR